MAALLVGSRHYAAHCATAAAPSTSLAVDPKLLTLCSQDAQAFRPPEEECNVLQVRLASNFKAARFEVEREMVDLPVKLMVHDSYFVPLAKWAMLLTGNYRCLMDDGMRSIKDAVHADLEASRSVYDWVVELCVALGADRTDMVPFDKYAASNASTAWCRHSGLQKGLRNASVDETVTRVDAWLGAQSPEGLALTNRNSPTRP